MATDINSADHIAKVLRGIQDRIPKFLLRNAMTQIKLTPTVEFIMEKALSDPNVSEEKKDKIRALKETGEYSRTTLRNNVRVQKQINNFVSREINKAIKSGQLPERTAIKDIDFIKEVVEKVKHE